MVSRNGDSISFALGITGSIIGLISLLLCCIGVALPSWYIGNNANNTNIVATANLFYSCYAPNATQGNISSTLKCVSYSSYLCSTTSYQNSVFNLTAYIPGCTNPNSDASVYLNFDAPIYQTSIDNFYRLRSAAVLSIISILFILFSIIFGFLTACITMNIYLVLIAPILALIAVIFGICGLVTAGTVFNYTGAGLALFITGILLESIVIVLLSIVAGRLNTTQTKQSFEEKESMFTQRIDSTPIIVRRVHKRRA